LAEKVFKGNLVDVLKNIDDFIKVNIIVEKPIRRDSFKEEQYKSFPFWALRELTLNAIMHRDYESNAPIYIYDFSDRIEIRNPGGLYGGVRPDNFPNSSDYRNPVLAEILKNLGYVNRFNYGIQRAQELFIENGNLPAVFDVSAQTHFLVTIFKKIL
jgi:ATP-dependent DNA helicase RecG